MCTTICLQWEPEIVAIAMIFLASKIKYEITDWEGRLPHQNHWWDMYVEDLTIEILEDICHQVLDLYSPKRAEEQPRVDSPPLSPVKLSGSKTNLHTNVSMGPSVQVNDHVTLQSQPTVVRAQPLPQGHSTAGNSVPISAPPVPTMQLIPPNGMSLGLLHFIFLFSVNYFNN